MQSAIDEALDSVAREVIVVVGPEAREINNDEAIVVINKEWTEGMASSIRCGLNAITAGTQQIILMMCDQPFVNAALLDNLIKVHIETGKPIVTSGFAGTFGPPVLFHHTLFPELLELKGDVGARKVVERHAGDVEIISFPKGEVDIDVEEDYVKLIDKNDR